MVSSHPQLASVGHSENPPGLVLEWADGLRAVIPFKALREACPCVMCRGKSGILPPATSPLYKKALIVTEINFVGNYALGLVWGDGHNTGIYPFEYLRKISEKLKIP